MDNPLNDPDSNYLQVLFWVDCATTVVFIIEALMKILAIGLICNGPRSYLRNTWNLLDFIIIIFSVLSLSPLSDSFKTFKIFRILRVLRLISRNEELKVALRALFLAIPNITNVTIIMLLFFLIFGVIGVSYFKGKLFYCFQPNSDLEDQLITKWDCISAGGEWVNRNYTFDNTIYALVTLFLMATTAGWAGIML